LTISEVEKAMRLEMAMLASTWAAGIKES